MDLIDRKALCFLLCSFMLVCANACSSTGAGKEYYDKGYDSWQKGRSDEAIATFSKGLKLEPKHEEMRLTLARIYFERGEGPHIETRRLLRQADAAMDKKDLKTSAMLKTQADARRKAAEIQYQACNEHLDEILDTSKSDKIIAHAAFLRFKTAFFFEDWKIAQMNLRRAIDKGGAEGTLKARYEGFLKRMERENPKGLLDSKDS